MPEYKRGDRVEYDGNLGTVTRRSGFGTPVAWYVRWDTGHVNIAWASDLLPVEDSDA